MEDSEEFIMRERAWRGWLAALSVVACVASMSIIAVPPMAQAAPVTATAAEQSVVIPKGPTFRDDNDTVYIPSDYGVRYHIYTYAHGRKTEVIYPESGLEYAKPGSYGTEEGLDTGVLVVVTAVSAGSATVLDGTTSWAYLFDPATDQIAYDDERSAITFPQLDGVEFSVKVGDNDIVVEGDTFQASGGATVTITGKTAVEEAPNVEIGGLDLTYKFPTVTTPKGPTFNEEAGTVYIPSDQGVRYYIVIDGKTITKDGLEYSKPGTYTETDGIVGGKLITVDAKSAGSATILIGATHWEKMFPLRPEAPTFDDEKTGVTIPRADGVKYYIDGGRNPVSSGWHSGKQGKEMTVEAKNPETGEVLATWKHTFPQKVTPKGPEFDDANSTVTIPSDQGVRYYIVIDGKTITKDGLEYSKPATYGISDGIVTGEKISIDAKSAGSSTILTGTTHWEHTLPYRPSSSLQNGDEFNDDSALVNTNWKVLSQKASGLKAGINVLYTPDNVTVKDGQLNIITERHCLAVDGNGNVTEEPSDKNLHPEPCGSGKRTVYTSGRIESGFDYSTPFEMEVRAYMDSTNPKGMHFAVWTRNNQPYCGNGVTSSNLAELDTMELYGDMEATTNTSHVTCVVNASGDDQTVRNYHVQNAALKGRWHTYKLIYDGYSIQYLFDGQPVAMDGTNVSRSTARTLGLSREQFQHALNDYPWQLIINNSVFEDNDWKPAPDDNKRFDTRVDRIDYVRIKNIPDVTPKGAINTYWSLSGGESGWLGYPTGDELSVRGGASQTFQGGTVFWNGSTGATHAVKGGI
ncbi:family 16 glycosylhydrolase, partial [Bifidobacterium phasiani]